MVTQTFQESSLISLPISLEQLALGIRKLSRSELLALELLLDTKAVKIIEASLLAEKNGSVKPFKVV